VTDSDIRQNIEFVFRTLADCDKSENPELVRKHWAEICGKWCQEIADEMERRIGKDVKK
jgi:hypothetical protein